MSRTLLAVLESVPHCYHGGGGITAYSAVTSMAAAGHKVLALILGQDRCAARISESEHIRHLEELGIEVLLLQRHVDPRPQAASSSWSKIGTLVKMLSPTLEDLFPMAGRAAEIARVVDTVRPDALFMYHWGAIAAVHKIPGVPRLGLVGDPIHLPNLFRHEMRRRYEPRPRLRTRLVEALDRHRVQPVQILQMVELLKGCTASGAFAAHHADFFLRQGVGRCGYFRTPVPDPLADGSSLRRREKAGKLKIMHIGHLQGIATLAGVELLAKEIIPSLEAALPPDSFEVHLVGGYFETMPEELRRLLTRPSVKVRGQMYPADEEFLSSHVLLVPTPIKLGIRVRIITGFSFGSCIVAHGANRLGIPELEHGENCLLGMSGAELASHCISLKNDEARRVALEQNARRTYEQLFSLSSAGTDIARAIEDVVSNG